MLPKDWFKNIVEEFDGTLANFIAKIRSFARTATECDASVQFFQKQSRMKCNVLKINQK